MNIIRFIKSLLGIKPKPEIEVFVDNKKLKYGRDYVIRKEGIVLTHRPFIFYVDKPIKFKYK